MKKRLDKKKTEADWRKPPKQATMAPTEDNYARSLEAAESAEKFQIVSFFLGGDEFAFELTEAVEVLRTRKLTEVPRVPSHIKGILSVRGDMVPVIDLKERLKISSGGVAGRILVITVEDVKAGFLVDKMGGVKEVPVSATEPVAGAEVPVPSEFLKGLMHMDGKYTLLLNASRLIGIQA